MPYRALLAIVLVLAQAGVALADDSWDPDEGDRTEATRSPATFEGMAWLFPLRLHLSHGGHVDGGMGGVDRETGELLLILPTDAFRVHLSLVDAVTPLGVLPRPVDGVMPAAPAALQENAYYRLRPTWRSHLGVALSILMPGTGQWIQKEDRELGALFFGSYLFLVGAAVMALVAPSAHSPIQRRITAGVLFGLAGTVTISSGAHAWVAGRERVEVRFGPTEQGERRRRRGGGSP